MNYSHALSNQYALEKTSVRAGWTINLRLINKILLAGIVVSFVAYLVANNDLAVKSFVLKDSRAYLSELNRQNQFLEEQSVAMSSYQYLSRRGSELKFVPANDIDYLPANNQVFAKR